MQPVIACGRAGKYELLLLLWIIYLRVRAGCICSQVVKIVYRFSGEVVRRIIHVDMDAYYAAIEQRDFAQFRNKPVVVGGDPANRGVVATCSYEARKFGIHSAMPCVRALRLCPKAIFVRPRFDVYRRVSRQIYNIMLGYTDLVEPLSLDEAYLDVTRCKRSFDSVRSIAKSIKNEIFRDTELTASAGISHNKFLAKIASDLNKPDGLTLITEKESSDFVRQLPIGKFYGIGPATEKKMQKLGIYTGEDLLGWSMNALKPVFGKVSYYYYHAARGIDDRAVETHRERKSIGSEKTFNEDIADTGEMLEKLQQLAGEVWQIMQVKEVTGRTITVKVKFGNFVQLTRSITVDKDIKELRDIVAHLENLLDRAETGGRRVRLLGVTVSNLDGLNRAGKHQLALF